MNRRTFIKSSSLATAGLAAGLSAPLFANDHDRKLKIGLIGSGWYGMVIAKAALEAGGVEVIAVADVDSQHLANSLNELASLQGSRPQGFKDYRELLETSGLEAVLIGTVTHWHALQFIAATRKGLPVYCEKPLAYDIEEGKAMVKAAHEAGNIVQIGFQRRQNKAFSRAKELIGEGRIGKVHQIEAQIHYNPNIDDTTIQDPPASLDWDAWCGPAPLLPYSPSKGHMSWRFEKAYGNGHLVDWGIHNIDIIRTIMGYDMPTSIEAQGGIHALQGLTNTPDTLRATMQFGEVPLIWQHRLWGTGEIDPQYNNGIFFHGEKGTLFAADNRLVLKPAGRNSRQEVMEIPSPRMQEEHVAEFIRAVRTGKRDLISCTIDDAFRSTATVQLAMIAYETGSRVKWDGVRQTITDNETAAAMLARPYREGYQRP